MILIYYIASCSILRDNFFNKFNSSRIYRAKQTSKQAIPQIQMKGDTHKKDQENLRGGQYRKITENQEILSSKDNRRKFKVFTKMSIQLEGKKTAEQCRGHHKKMKQRHYNVRGIVQYLKKQAETAL